MNSPKNPFQLIKGNLGGEYTDYEASLELPPLKGKGRSVNIRLSLLKEPLKEAKPVLLLTYEVDGCHTELKEETLTAGLLHEIVGSPHGDINADLLSSLKRAEAALAWYAEDSGECDAGALSEVRNTIAMAQPPIPEAA